MHQVIAVMVDKTDFATVESGVVGASVTATYWGVNTGGSTATASAAVSKAVSDVNSGLVKVILKGTENNYDFMFLKLTESATSCADQHITWTNVDVDQSDIYSLCSNINSNLGPSVATRLSQVDVGVDNLEVRVASTLTSVVTRVSQIDSGVDQLQSRLPDEVASAVWLADKGSYVAASSMGSVLQTAAAPTASAVASKVWSDYESKVGFSISAADKGTSNALSGLSDVLSKMGGPEHIASLVWDADKGSYVDASSMGSVLQAGTATPSAIWGFGYSDLTDASSVGSMVRVGMSRVSTIDSGVDQLQTRVTAEVATSAAILAQNSFLSYISDVVSDIQSEMVAVSSGIDELQSRVTDNIASMVWDADKGSYVDASSMGSVLQAGTATPSAVAAKVWSDYESKVGASISAIDQGASNALSGLSDVLSKMGGPEHIASLVWDADTGRYVGASSMGSVLQAATATPSAVAAKVWSDFESKVGSTVSDMYSTLAAGSGATPSQIWGFGYSDATEASSMGSMVRVASSRTSTTDSGVNAIQTETTSLAARVSQVDSGVDALQTSVTVGTGSLSNIGSRVWSEKVTTHSLASSFGSQFSDIHSRAGGSADNSAIAAKVWSDFESKIGSTVSDMYSQLAASSGTTPSAVWGYGYSDLTEASSVGSMLRVASSRVSDLESAVSDIDSQLTLTDASVLAAKTQATAGASRALLNQSRISDVYSLLSDHNSDFQSRVTAPVATSDQLSQTESNLTSQISDLYDLVSDIDSQVNAGVPITSGSRESLVDEVWDEVLTGVSHNVVNSSGRRLRQLQEAGTYAGCIWIDTVNGTGGTTSFENGTDSKPVNNMADANTLATNLGISTFCIAPGSSITFAASQENQNFIGKNWTLALGGQSISGSLIEGASVSGTATGAITPEFRDCHFNSATLPPSHLESCGLEATITAGSAGTFFFDLCHSGVAGTSTPVFDFGSGLNASNVNFRHYSGGIEIQNMGAGSGSYNMSLEGWGQLVINANCSATSTIAIRGAFSVTDNAGGAVTLSDDARYEKNHVADALLARDVDNAEPTGDEHTMRLMILMAMEANLEDNAGFITIYQTDGATEVVQKAVTTDATADPVTGVS
jgi:hypothetical protein